MFFSKRYLPGFIALALILGAIVLKTISQAMECGESVGISSASLPSRIGEWRLVKHNPMAPVVHEMLADDARDWNTYRRGDEVADLLVLYGHRKRTFHMPEQCLAGAGMTVTNRQAISLKLPGHKTVIPFNALMLQKDGAVALALYTFIGPDGKATDLLGLNMSIFMCRMRGEKPKGAVLRVIGPMEPDKPLEAQSICDLAARALGLVGQKVIFAGSYVPGSGGRKNARIKSEARSS